MNVSEQTAAASADIDQQALEWFTTMQSDGLPPETLQAFDEWLAQSAAHREAYLEAELLADDLAELAHSEYANDIRHGRQISDSSQRQNETGKNLGAWVADKWQSLFPSGYGLASGLTALALLLVGFLLLAPISTEQPEFAVQEQRVVSTRGENKSVQLADGSNVTLGPESEIVYRAEATHRHVILSRGDAFFDVTSNPNKPFFVYAGNIAIKVVGTRFDVRRQPSGTSVAVVEGTVQVFDPLEQSGQQVTTLVMGQRARNHQANDLFKLDVEQGVNIAELASWRQGRLVYKRALLQDVIADANRYLTNGQLLLANRQLQSEQVTLSVNVDELGDLPQMLAQLLPLKVEKLLDDTVLVEKDR